ncbi:retrovirus-related pol polyprotein from transposon TNT 1-94 [Tanacetum coccineum]
MKNFLKSGIVWESRKEILVSLHPRKTTPIVQSCQIDPEAPPLSLINQDLLYLKKGSSGPKKIVLSLHKFPSIIFNDDDIDERTSIWVNNYQDVLELGHEHKFMIEIVARRANECIVSITELDYKNLNKNDIEDMYLLIMNDKVPDYAEIGLLWSLSVFIRSSVIWKRVHDFQLGIKSYQQKVNLTAPTISFPGVEKYKMFSIIYEPVHGIIYKNSKKEKRVMRHSEIHKFCDATLNRVLEGLRSYNNDVKYGYIQRDLTNEEVEYLKLFEEEIEHSLYGLKQASHAWFQHFAGYATRICFQQSKTYSSLFVFHRGYDIAYLSLYVDDIILTASSAAFLQRVIASLHGEFSMKYLGSLNYFLGISAQWSSTSLFLSQSTYVEEILKRAHM